MTDFASLLQPDRGEPAHAIHLVDKDSFADWLKRQPRAAPRLARRAPLRRQDRLCQFAILPRRQRRVRSRHRRRQRRRSCRRGASPGSAEALPAGNYRLAEGEPGKAALGWLLAQHRFDRYQASTKEPSAAPRVLLTGEAATIDAIVRLAEATALVRDLVDTPAADLGPAELEAAVRDAGRAASAPKVEVTAGDALAKGYPMIAAVGGGRVAASARRG